MKSAVPDSTLDIRHSAFLVLLLLAASDPQQPLRECRAITDDPARLACYDALPGRPAEPAAASQEFGKRRPAPTQEVKSVQSRLVGGFDGWKRGTIFRLQNGQRWKATGDDAAYYHGIPENAAVTITRNFFGAYWMEVEGVGRSVKVTRLD